MLVNIYQVKYMSLRLHNQHVWKGSPGAICVLAHTVDLLVIWNLFELLCGFMCTVIEGIQGIKIF